MSEETNVSADVNSGAPESGDIDNQLTQMREAETGQVQEAKAEDAKTEPEQGEVKVKEEKVVPLAALHEERNALKQLQQEIARQREMMEKVNQRLEVLMNPKQPEPDRSDPVQYLDHKIGQVSEQTRQLLEQQQRVQAEQQQQQYFGQLAQRINTSEAAFAQETPDYVEAVKYLDTARVRELMVFGIPQEQAAMQAAQERVQAALQWAHSGQNPAQIAYEFAKARGYAPKTAQVQVSAQDKIAAQQKGVAAAKSLGSGGATTGKLTAEALANMSDEEFAALSDAQFRKAMGG